MKVNADFQPARRAGRPAVDRRDEILDAAQRLYERIGFEKTTVTDIARELAMSPANLYRSFPDRRAIDEAVAGRRLRLIEDAAWSAARAAADDPETALRVMAVSVLRTTRELLFVQGHMNRLCAVACRDRWPVVERYLDSLHGAVRHIVIEGQKRGAFAPRDPDGQAGVIVQAMTRVWHPHMIEVYHDADLEADAVRLADLVIGGLKQE